MECGLNGRCVSLKKQLPGVCFGVWQVQFEVADVTKREFPRDSFDVIFSRDTILHIKDKHALLSKFYVRLVNNNYCVA